MGKGSRKGQAVLLNDKNGEVEKQTMERPLELRASISEMNWMGTDV